MAGKVAKGKGKKAASAGTKKKTKAAPKKTAAPKKKTTKKAATKRKSRSKSAKGARMKAYWGVFNQSLKRVALFEFNERKKADKRAKELSATGKSPHFVQPVKEPVTE